MDSGRPGFVRAPGLGPRDYPHSPGAKARCVLPRGSREAKGSWLSGGLNSSLGRQGVCHLPLCATLGCSGPLVLRLCREREPATGAGDWTTSKASAASARRSNPSCAVSRRIGSSLLAYMLVCAWSQRETCPSLAGKSTVISALPPCGVTTLASARPLFPALDQVPGQGAWYFNLPSFPSRRRIPLCKQSLSLSCTS